MKIVLLCVGRVGRLFAPAMGHYVDLLRPYASVQIHEVPEAPPTLGEPTVRTKEGTGLLRLVREGSVTVALDRAGKQLSSEELSAFLVERKLRGYSSYQFILGGAFGLDEQVVRAADFVWSLSELTFPHQMARCLVLEQLYRAMRIERGEPYHH